ncbi:response regulator transcription factor [Maribacter algarum]|uniref:Response regulator transcription factor n=1 Tax=Maribacter algarum (ex Zhang et al. 2020) TaxID=2578118 RepID=A0A5S3PMX9_9FLAO|nr:response regulator transcription factor [Maribacter algarum]TMM55828.1 response regulator transcription factor [Maribacter algarum]
MNFKKVFVAEDTDSNNFGIVAKLGTLNIKEVNQAQYCDDALLKIKKAIFDKNPYQLLISDLSYDNTYRKNKITTGETLISEVKKIQPSIKVIVFSVIDKQTTIQSLFTHQQIDGYVCKGTNGLKELERAIEALNNSQKYTCPIATASLQQKNLLQLNTYEQQLLQLLANGYKQSEISIHFKKHSITPNSVRSIESCLSKLKDDFNASTPAQLVHLVTSLGLI